MAVNMSLYPLWRFLYRTPHGKVSIDYVVAPEEAMTWRDRSGEKKQLASARSAARNASSYRRILSIDKVSEHPIVKGYEEIMKGGRIGNPYSPYLK